MFFHKGSEANNPSTAVTGRYLSSSSPAYNAVGADCTSQLQQVGSLPIIDGIAPEFLARHTIDQGLRDSVYQSPDTGNGTTLWNGEQGGAFNMYPWYHVHWASNAGIPHGYAWNQSRFQADSSSCPTHVRQPIFTATVMMPCQPCGWYNTLGPVGLIQTSCHGMYTAKCTDLFVHVYKTRLGIFLNGLNKNLVIHVSRCLF